jgi:oxygen-independent coproporphyrinogen-3 oxidase
MQLKARKFDTDEGLACDMYEELVGQAGAAGLQQYEVANFARNVGRQAGVLENWRNGEFSNQCSNTPSLRHSTIPSPLPAFACRHNVNYWRGGSFHGLGPSATGYVRGARTKNWANTQLYCEQLEKGKHAIESSEELPSLKRAGETAAFGLRMNLGWPFEQFRETTGHDLRNEWTDEMHRCVEQGWGQISSESFQLTHHGLRFADSAAELFLR